MLNADNKNDVTEKKRWSKSEKTAEKMANFNQTPLGKVLNSEKTFCTDTDVDRQPRKKQKDAKM